MLAARAVNSHSVPAASSPHHAFSPLEHVALKFEGPCDVVPAGAHLAEQFMSMLFPFGILTFALQLLIQAKREALHC